jgi:hypothetical protein
MAGVKICEGTINIEKERKRGSEVILAHPQHQERK